MSDEKVLLIDELSRKFPHIKWEVCSSSYIEGYDHHLDVKYIVQVKMGGWLVSSSKSHFIQSHSIESAILAVQEVEITTK